MLACAVGLVIAGGSVASASMPTHLVISQIYGGGGNTGAPYTHDYVELFNPTAAPISLDGLSIQYASATGTGNFGANAGQLTALSGSVAPGGYFLVQQAAGAGNGEPLPPPDLIDPVPINMAAGAGKVVLVTGTSSLGCNGGSAPCSADALARIVDLVGYGNANFYEGSGAAPTLSNTTAAFRLDGGRVDTNDNAADFTAGPPAPRNSATVPPGEPRVVVSQVYGGGGNSGATYTHDFIELYNAGTAPASLAGWSVQYASATGSSWQVTALSGTIQPGRYYLVQQAAGAGGTTPLPTPDATGSTNMSATAGKVALVNVGTALSGTCPAGSAVVDFVGFGSTANCFEGTGPTPAPSNVNAVLRAESGCRDTDDNAADFAAGAPTPRNSASPAHVCDAPPADLPPTVLATIPTDGATDVSADSDVTVIFSEPVTVAGDWFSIVCTVSGTRSAVSSGGPETFTLSVSGTFTSGESCTVTVFAAQVTDQDGTPQQMAADYIWSFQVAELFACGEPVTRIHTIQGSGSASPLVGTSATVEAVVVGSYQGPNQFSGFYLQERDEHADGDPATSEGIFVFAPTAPAVERGDVVRVRGTVAEFNGLTQISSVNALEVCDTGASVTPAQVTFPVPSIDHLERYEGMLVEVTQYLTVTEVFTLARFGEISLSAAGRLYIPTAVTEPGAAAAAVADQNARSRIVLDDGFSNQNPDPVIYPQGGLSASNTLRVGDSLPEGVTGVMDFRFSLYRIQPVGEIEFEHTNPRQEAPDDVGGNFKVASFNVLNYFNGDGQGGGFPTPRGARNAFELERQRTKIVSAIERMDADVVGLMEIENDADPHSAIADLVAGLNDAMGAGTYAYVDTGIIGGDAIKVAFIYKPGSVRLVGDWKILTEADDPRFNTARNRPALAQTFQHLDSGEKMTLVVNHLKSKGSGCGAGDDATDGSGNCDGTRTQAAAALVDWLAADPTGSGDADVMIIGDLNAYTFERPITTIEAGGYVNLIREHGGLGAYSYVFNGESGYLDHALANESLAAKVSGVTEWHINPDEPIALEYGTSFKSPGQIESFYDPGPFRSSDHDPVIVGLQLDVTFAWLRTLTREWVTHAGIAGSLVAKLNAAEAAAARGNVAAKAGQLAAYANELLAQSGKAIDAERARVLIRAAGAL
jgi:uncharacterized protein